jgi:hypothetical protein
MFDESVIEHCGVVRPVPLEGDGKFDPVLHNDLLS